jgi:hypothetical protein
VFVPAGPVDVNGIDGTVFGLDGELYVSSRFSNSVCTTTA